MTDLSYPIGRFDPEASLTADDRAGLIDRIAGHPARFRAAVEGLTPEQIDTPYLTETSSGLTFAVDRFKDWQHGAHITLRRGERSRLADYASDVL